jgi:membrane dipeptidase
MTTPGPVIFDGHNDTLLNLYMPERGGGRSFFDRGTPENGHIDLPRARDAGFGGGFFAIFAPSQRRANAFEAYATKDGYDFPLNDPLPYADAYRSTLAMMALLFRLERESDGALKVVRTVDEIEDCLRNGVMASVLHIEGAEAIDEDMHALEVFYAAGLRSLGIVWSRPNIFAQGVPLRFPGTPDIGPGLADAGKRLVQACNQLGIMIDLSHITEAGFWDVAKLSDAPLVATHSNVHALCNHPRNLTDKQLDAIAESGGMVGINFGVGFLREDGKWDAASTSLTEIVRHINYLVERIGVDHVGFGSDMDGVRVPTAFGDVTGMTKIVELLRESGHDDKSLAKICGRNWIDLLRRTLKP